MTVHLRSQGRAENKSAPTALASAPGLHMVLTTDRRRQSPRRRARGVGVFQSFKSKPGVAGVGFGDQQFKCVSSAALGLNEMKKTKRAAGHPKHGLDLELLAEIEQ